MKLLTKEIEKKLRHNSKHFDSDKDLKPTVKYFNPCGSGTWLITELDEDGRMFGLCDLGMGSPELGYVMLDELQTLKLPFGLGIERDLLFEADKTISKYAEEAREIGYIKA
jgi:hypothetical protein